MVLVDTSVWSLGLRRQLRDLTPLQQRLRSELHELIAAGRARMLGAVRQEILSGVREDTQYRRLRDELRTFLDVSLASEDYEEAARIYNACRATGVAGSGTDYLLCAVALARNWEIFTLDRDFDHYAKAVKVRLYQPRHAN